MSENYPDMPTPQAVSDIESLRHGDPELFDAMQVLLQAMRDNMLPEEAQMEFFETMDASVRRAIVQHAAGLEASVIVTFKEQLNLVNKVCSQVISPEGLPLQTGHKLGITVKDAMNMSMKIVGMLVKDLPKVITLARVQRKENVLLEVISSLEPEAQERALALLEKLEMEAAKHDQ
ncbi:hypothetical protein [Pseudomonas sp.]|uniref:hypothetical protein n=1 Tax=Pseudomonas sp. TaxID=306 RepID=UPI003FD74754